MEVFLWEYYRLKGPSRPRGLHKKCKPVKEFDKDLGILLDQMYETMLAADGVGLAAPQIGILKQIAVVDVEDEIAELN